MSKITGNTYPVNTDNKDGDQFVIVRNGQLQKVTRGALKDYIEGLAPNQFIGLDDVPGSYVGQQGQGLVVNSSEDGLEFAATVSSNFLALTDTPTGYGGNAGNLAVVNSGETALEFIPNAFIRLADTPASFAGSSEYILRVNTAANAVEFVTAETAAPTGSHTGGWFDFDNASGTQNYTSTGTFVTVVNDAAGPDTRSDFAPPGVTDVYDESTNAFDFSQLSVGDQVMIRVDVDIETTVSNQEVSMDLLFDNGGSPFRLALSRTSFKTSGANKQITPEARFYIGSDAVRNNPVEVQLRSDANTNIDLRGYAVFITKQGAL